MSVAICLVCGLVYILVEHFGALAQLVARFHGMEEVRGSNPLCSTLFCLDIATKTACFNGSHQT